MPPALHAGPWSSRRSFPCLVYSCSLWALLIARISPRGMGRFVDHISHMVARVASSSLPPSLPCPCPALTRWPLVALKRRERALGGKGCLFAQRMLFESACTWSDLAGGGRSVEEDVGWGWELLHRVGRVDDGFVPVLFIAWRTLHAGARARRWRVPRELPLVEGKRRNYYG